MAITRRFHRFRQTTREEFSICTAPLLALPEVQKLEECAHHVNYTRLNHSLDVAYLSFCIAKLTGCDAVSCARGGLLHDMFYRDDAKGKKLVQMKNHPKEALENAKAVCSLNPIEEDIILKHMWLINSDLPKYKESFIVTFVDKACAVRERIFGMSKRRINTRRRRLAAVLQVTQIMP